MLRYSFEFARGSRRCYDRLRRRRYDGSFLLLGMMTLLKTLDLLHLTGTCTESTLVFVLLLGLTGMLASKRAQSRRDRWSALSCRLMLYASYFGDLLSPTESPPALRSRHCSPCNQESGKRTSDRLRRSNVLTQLLPVYSLPLKGMPR